MEKIDLATGDIAAENAAKLAELFPDIVTEVRDEDGVVRHSIDVEALKAHVGDIAEDKRERYQFTWPGKQKARAEAIRPIDKTMRPCPEESVNWDTTENLYIEGDNLDALKILRETYAGKIKMIYIDPPYNTGHDFVYNDSFARSAEEEREESGAFDDEGNLLDAAYKVNSESNGKFHSDWCSMMYPRLMLARDLLSEDGVLLLSIDNAEQSTLVTICNEVFGDANRMACFPRVTKKAGKSSDHVAWNHDYVLMYSKGGIPTVYRPHHTDSGFSNIDEYVDERGRYKLNQTLDYDSLQYSPSLDYVILHENQEYYPGGSKESFEERQRGNHARADWAWRWSKDLFEFGLNNDFIVFRGNRKKKRIYTKTYERAKIVRNGSSYSIEYEDRTKPLSSLTFVENQFSNDNAKKDLVGILNTGLFDYSKPVQLLRELIRFGSSENDIVLDFFSGSATTAHAVMQLNAEDGGNRKFIMVQLPEPCDEKSEAAKAGYANICEIGKERIRRAGKKIAAEVEGANAQLKLGEEAKKVPDIGFRVLKIDSSNFEDVKRTVDAYRQDALTGLADNLKPDRSAEDLLFQLFPQFEIPYTARIEKLDINGKTVYSVDEDALLACFDQDVPEDVIRAMAQRQPSRVVLRDASFIGDDALANFEEIFKTLSPETQARVV